MEVCVLGDSELDRALELSYRSKLRDIEKTASYRNDPVLYKKTRAEFYREKFQSDRYKDGLTLGEMALFGVCRRKRLLGAALLDTRSGEILFVGTVKKKEDLIRAMLFYEMALRMMKNGPGACLYFVPEDETAQFMRRMGFFMERDICQEVRYFRSCEEILKEGRPRAGTACLYRGAKVLFFGLAGLFLVEVTKYQLGQIQITKNYTRPERVAPQNERNEDAVSKIRPFRSEALPYSVEEKTYLKESTPDKSFFTSLDEIYPVIQGMKNADAEEKINTALKEMALETETRFITEPTSDVKNYMIVRAPMVISKGRGRILLATEDLLSAVFEDKIVAGDQKKSRIELRSALFNAKTGEVYTLSDVIAIDEKFAGMWKKKLKAAYPEVHVFDKASEKDIAERFQKSLWKPDQTLQSVFFLTGENVEIGFSYYSEEGENGYVTVSLTPEEIRPYEKNEKFWETYRKNIDNGR